MLFIVRLLIRWRAGVVRLAPSIGLGIDRAHHRLGFRNKISEPASLAERVDRMKSEGGDVKLLAIGGGSSLIPDYVEGCSEVIRVEHPPCRSISSGPLRGIVSAQARSNLS